MDDALRAVDVIARGANMDYRQTKELKKNQNAPETPKRLA